MKPLAELRIMGVRMFRAEFPTLIEPVVVISRNQIKGVWVPGVEAIASEAAAAVVDLTAYLVKQPEVPRTK